MRAQNETSSLLLVVDTLITGYGHVLDWLQTKRLTLAAKLRETPNGAKILNIHMKSETEQATQMRKLMLRCKTENKFEWHFNCEVSCTLWFKRVTIVNIFHQLWTKVLLRRTHTSTQVSPNNWLPTRNFFSCLCAVIQTRKSDDASRRWSTVNNHLYGQFHREMQKKCDGCILRVHCGRVVLPRPVLARKSEMCSENSSPGLNKSFDQFPVVGFTGRSSGWVCVRTARQETRHGTAASWAASPSLAPASSLPPSSASGAATARWFPEKKSNFRRDSRDMAADHEMSLAATKKIRRSTHTSTSLFREKKVVAFSPESFCTLLHCARASFIFFFPLLFWQF